MVEIMEVAVSSTTAITTTEALADAIIIEAHYNLAESYYLKLLSFQN